MGFRSDCLELPVMSASPWVPVCASTEAIGTSTSTTNSNGAYTRQQNMLQRLWPVDMFGAVDTRAQIARTFRSAVNARQL
jgi:hypothetical protein